METVSERHTMVDKSKLRKTLLAMKRRVKEFGDLHTECCCPLGWASTEIYRFEKDMEELVKQALEDEERNG